MFLFLCFFITIPYSFYYYYVKKLIVFIDYYFVVIFTMHNILCIFLVGKLIKNKHY